MDDRVSSPTVGRDRWQKFCFRLWLIPVAGCLIILCTQGTMRSNGLIFVALIHEGHGRGVASAPFSLFGAASIAVGPMVGFLGYRMSFLALTSLGLSLLLLSHFVCFFTTNIYVVTILMGFLKSASILLITTTIPRMIITAFKERRATAMGISTLGVPLAGFFWPPITQIFLETYGLKGTFLLLGGITLHGMIGILIINGSKQLIDKIDISDQNTATKIDMPRKTVIHCEVQPSEMIELLPSSGVADAKPQEIKRENFISDLASLKEPNVTFSNISDKTKEINPMCDTTEEPPSSRLQIFKKVLANHGFYLLSFTNAVNLFTQNGLNQVIVDYMADKDHDVKSAILMITAYSAAGIIGRPSLGWVADKGFVSSHVQKAAGMFLTSSSIILTTFTDSFSLLCVCFIVMGLSQASSATVNLVQYSHYFAKHEIIMALALSKVIHGFFQLSRSPALGIFRDVYESYNCIFRTMGLFMYMLACLWLVEGYLFKKRKTKELFEKESNIQVEEDCQDSGR